jgi:hypothetical protein
MKGIEVRRKSSKSEVKGIEVKCSDVRWNGAVGNLSGFKQNERIVDWTWVKLNGGNWSVEMFSEVEWSIVGWSVVKCSGSLTNRLSDIIRRFRDNMVFAAFMFLSFIIFLHVLWFFFIIVYCFMFCIILFLIL